MRSQARFPTGGGFFVGPPPPFLLALLLCLDSPALLAAGPDDEQDGSEVEVVEIRGERPPSGAALPSSSVTVVEAGDMGPGLVTTSMMARAAPSVRIREFGGIGQQVTVGLRGAAPHQTQVQIDGVPLPDPFGSGVDLSSIPVAFIERMEVVRGAASVQAGSGALGGVVNLVTRSERDPGYYLRLSAGSYGTWKGHAGAVAGSGASRFLVMASGLTTAGDFSFRHNNNTLYNPYDDREESRDNNDAKHGGWLVKASTELASGLRLHLTHRLTAFERGVAGILGFTATRARESGWSGVVDLRGQGAVGEAIVEAGANLLLTGRHFTDPGAELTGVPLDDAQEGQDLEGFASLLVPLGGGHLVRARLACRSSLLRASEFRDPERTELAARAGADFSLFADRVVLSPGVGAGYFTDAGWQWAPSLGARFGIVDDLSIQANLARAYRVPNFNELYLQSGTAVGNPELRPESAWTGDAGLVWSGWRRWRIALVGFFARYQDLIVFELSSNFRYRPLNVGGAELGGLELEIAGELVRGFTAVGHYTFLMTADRSGQPNREGNELPGRPRHTAGLRLQGHWGRFLSEAELYFVSSNFTNQANTSNKLPARLLLSAGAGAEVGRGVTVMLQARNLLADQGFDVRGLPIEGISFFITVGVTGKESS